MKIANQITALAAAAVVLVHAAPAPALAQHGGFHAGIARPAFGFPPTQAPAVVVRGGTFTGNGGFIAAPIGGVAFPFQPFGLPGQQFIIPGQQFVFPNQVMIPHQPGFVPYQPGFVPNPVVVPNQLLVPGQTVVPPLVFPTGPPIYPVQAPIQIIPAMQAPIAYFGPPVRLAPPPAGTPRAQVLRQFGEPTISVITSRGEILRFRGDVTVVIQNGQVAGPR